MKNWSIQTRVLFVALVPTVCIALFLSLYFSRLRMLDIENTVLSQARAAAAHLAAASEFGVVSANNEFLKAIAISALSDPNFRAIRITDVAGQTLAFTEREKNYNSVDQFSEWFFKLRPLFTDKPLNLLIRNGIFSSIIMPVDDYSTSAELENSTLIGWIEIDVGLREASARQFELLFESLALTLLAIAATVLLANWIASTVTRPIKIITEAVDQLGAGNLQVRSTTSAGGELGRLQQGINNMATVIQASQDELEREVQRATRDLQTTFAELEKRNEELEEARLAAVQASEFKSQFLANMSHEIRTPINAILGFSELLSKTAKDPLQKDYLNTIRTSADSLLGLLNDILDLSKVESGKLVLEKTHVSLNAVLNEIYTLFSPQAANKEIEFFVELLDERYTSVKTDPLRLRQVLVNLVNNAIKFTSQGHVLLSTTCTSESEEKRVICFSIEDTGPGIPKMAQANLFRAFTQGDMSTSRRFGGTGLGLHIANEIVFLMEGDIDFESEPGVGTVFRVTVPLDIDSKAKLRSRPLPQRVPITLLDDYPPLRPYYMQLFSKAGFDVADNISIPAPGTKMVLVNFTVNRLFKGEFKLSDKLPDVPVLAFSSSYDPATVRRLELVGYDGIVAKSCDPRRVRYGILNYLAKNISQNNAPIFKEAPVENNLRKGLLILIVDDHPINLKLAESYCRHLGIEADYAESATKGIELASHKHYDLIFMDVHMPIIDGLEATKRIRNGQGINANTPIVALTADAYQSTKQELIHAGAQDIVVKPMSLDMFRAAVDAWNTTSLLKTSSSVSNTETNQQLIMRQKKLAMEQELQGMLISRLPEYKREIMNDYRVRDLQALQHHAHRLNGASAYCNVPRLTQAASSLEGQLKKQQIEKLDEAVSELLNAIEELLAGKEVSE